MTLKQALTLARERLAVLKDLDDPAFEAEVLLRQALQITRAQLYLDLNSEVPSDREDLFLKWIERRLRGEPTAYLIHCREFFGLEFYVDQRVLIPRPETELLVEQALKIIHNHPIKTIADIGTGSGAIAISIAKTIDFSSHSGNSMPFPSQEKLASQDRAVPDRPLVPIIFASDISTDALAVASLNARKHCVAEYITFLQGDLLEPLPTSIDLLIANLPYVTSLEVNQMPSAKYEPVLALDGGKSGLDQIFRIAEQIKGRVNSGGRILLEIGMGQSQAVVEHMNKLYPSAKIETLPDLAGIDRVVIISEFHA